MKRLLTSVILTALVLICQAQPTREQVGPQAMPKEIAPITAPFEMPQLQRPAFPQLTVTVKMPRKGLATKAIQQAIDQTAAKGGGTVVIPAGDWQTGRITLRSNINLHLAEGCRLHFSGKIADYQPIVFTRDEGIEIYSLGAFIYANGEHNIALTGRGEIIGPSIDCEIYQQNKAYCLNIEQIVGEQPLEARRYDGIKTKEVFLPKTIAPINCTNVLIEGVTLNQGLYWNVVPQYCDSVIIRGVTVNSFGHGRTDGIDVESTSNVLIEYCSLDCQDDTYTMKSGRGWDGLRINRPTENVVVRHSLALRGAGGIVCGTEVAGGVNNVYCHDCVFDGTDQAFRYKSRRTRGGGISNIFVERVRANVKYSAFYCDLLGETKWMGELAQRYPTPPRTKFTPYFHDISVHDVIVENCRELVNFNGQPELPVKNVFFGNATVTCQRIGHVQDVTGFAMKDVNIHTTDSILTIDNCSVVNIFGVNNADLKAPVKVVQKGEPSKYVSVQEVPMEPVVYSAVHPGKVWLDTEGKPIQAHGFQITCIDGTYYWYGENKADALLGTTRMFGGVRCYSSKDFYNWEDEGLIIAPDTLNPLSPIHYSQKLERPHIIRNPRTGKFVLWAKSQAEDGYFAIFQADQFLGPYTFVRNLQPEGYGVGDFDMYVDEQTGKGYVWFERPHWELICADLTDDFLNVTDVYSNHFVGQKPPFTREAPAHFVANGKHYLFTSGTTGYTSNPSEVAVFDDYHGDYRILGDPHVGDSCASSFNSQITGIIKVPGKDLWIALADRWEPHTTGTDFARRTFEAKKGSYANYKPQPQKPVGTEPQVVDRRYKLVDMAHAVYHAGYVFLPITFEDGTPKIHWQEEWQLPEADEQGAAQVVWFDGSNPISYNVSKKADPVVKIALDMFKSDMQQVTGLTPVANAKGTIQIIQKPGNDDGFHIYVKNGQITIEGNGGRGTAYGILELSRMAGVSPWIWWGDCVPEKKDRLTIGSDFETAQKPSVAYRGIFINDEDWSTRPWSCKNFEPGPDGRIGAQTYKKIFQLLLRLRGNAIWPGMHEGTTAFFQVEGAKAVADSCGIVIGTSHCEPLMRNNVGEWNVAERGRFNYKTNREAVHDYWIERLKEVKGKQNNIFTIGMRGIHDSSMEGYSTQQEKYEGLQQVIDDQQQLIRKYVGSPHKQTQMFVPYKEVLELYEMGLKVPDYVTLMWCDDNYGYMTRYSSDAEQQRIGGGGIYYHLSYWGRPHDYLWLTTTQPGLIYNEMREAYDRHVRKMWIANVHDPKVAGYDLELFMDMAWNINSVSALTLNDHYCRWLCRQFGEKAGRRLFPAMRDFYRLCGERRPEFTGFTQVELDKKLYNRGLSPVTTVDWDKYEAEKRLADFEYIKAAIQKCRSYVRPELHDAFYTAIQYPVFATAAMNQKILGDSAESHRAYEEIQALTAQYNQIKDGKWCGLMDAAPRKLPVYEDVHATLAADHPRPLVTRNACDYQQATAGAKPVQMLGYSMNAMALPKDGCLTYEFGVETDGDYTLQTALIPTHAVDAGDIRYSVSIDGAAPTVYSLKEPFRSEEWKRNVLRGQALRYLKTHLGKGSHTLTIQALDDHIVVDQWTISE